MGDVILTSQYTTPLPIITEFGPSRRRGASQAGGGSTEDPSADNQVTYHVPTSDTSLVVGLELHLGLMILKPSRLHNAGPKERIHLQVLFFKMFAIQAAFNKSTNDQCW